MKVVRNLVTERYMGRWYEIALFPSFFQPKNGKDTRTTYNLNSDGSTVHVLNETWSDGKRDSIEGTAYKANPKSDEAKLKVKFYLPLFLPLILVTGNYWVLYVDPDYQYVLIGEPLRKSLWVWSFIVSYTMVQQIVANIVIDCTIAVEDLLNLIRNLYSKKLSAINAES
ncbi:hypothetical protein ACS0TY_034193 [Phlomoides rotata]